MAAERFNEHGLTERQELFIKNYVASGGVKRQSALDAGYSKSCAGPRASDLLSLPKIQARMEVLSREMMAGFAPSCMRVLHEIAVGGESATVRERAATSLLDRSGYKAPVKLEIEDFRTTDDIDKELAILLGISPEELGITDVLTASEAPQGTIDDQPIPEVGVVDPVPVESDT